MSDGPNQVTRIPPVAAQRPDGGRIVTTGGMAVARAAHTATLLPTGKVLIAGGCVRDSCEMGDLSATAELYDPAGGSFTPAGRMTIERAGHTATLLSDGTVFIAGGWQGNQVTASAEIYDPATSKFASIPAMTMRRADHTATLLPGGKVLIVGGYDGGRRLASAEQYDPRTRTFTPAGSMAVARAGHTSSPLPDGRVLVAGGSTGRGEVLASAELYDPLAATFTQTGNMTAVRHKHAAAALRDGTVLIIGGSDARDGYGQYDSVEVYDPTLGTFAAAGRMNAKRYKLSGAVVLLAAGDVLVGGGDQHVEVYDPTTRSFRRIEGSIGTARSFATVTLLPDGSVLIAGGYDTGIHLTAGAWLYQP